MTTFFRRDAVANTVRQSMGKSVVGVEESAFDVRAPNVRRTSSDTEMRNLLKVGYCGKNLCYLTNAANDRRVLVQTFCLIEYSDFVSL
jgi:hypothetical protein